MTDFLFDCTVIDGFVAPIGEPPQHVYDEFRLGIG
jgi:hypothetical protein